MVNSCLWLRFCVFVMMLLPHTVYAGANLDEFDLSNSAIELTELRSGGPRKDGIPALNYPKLVSVNKSNFLKDSDIIVGIVIEGKARAYPIRILNWHEIVNDRSGDTDFALTWCPLTKSAVAFNRRVADETLEFGVSGLLYNSNVVMYDRTNDGLWSQLKWSGLTGKNASQSLSLIPTQLSTWGDWKSLHPDTAVLEPQARHLRQYDKDPYKFYHMQATPMFHLPLKDARLKPKDTILGVIVQGQPKAYPLTTIIHLQQPMNDTIAGEKITIFPQNGLDATIKDKDGNVIPSVVAYWFAWSNFHQDTLVNK